MAALSVIVPPSAAHATPPLAAVDLGRSSSFAILAGDSVGNTATGPITVVRGDLGVVAAAGAITGFPPGEVRGIKYAVAAAAVADARTDLFVAYADAVGRTSTVALAGDLMGLTLLPGVHTSTAAVNLSGGTVTLSGGGDPNAVFIFQVEGALTMAANTHVVLTNNAQAKNVFWQVNGAGAIGANAEFAGTMMTATAIAVGANSLFNGRALAKTGAITTNSNQFYSVTPAVTINGGPAASVADDTPTITGTVTVNVPPLAVSVTVGTQVLAATVQVDGTWAVTAAILANNTYSVSAAASDAVGNQGSAAQLLTIDTVLPVVSIVGGASVVTNDTTPTLSGSTDVIAGSLVTVTIAGQTLTGLVQGGGGWNVTPTTLASGATTVNVLVHDEAGNPGSATQTLTIDVTAPVVTITGGATALTSDTTPALAGTTSDGTIAVSIDGQVVAGVVIVGSGWTVAYPTLRAPLGGGDHYISVTGTDAAGNATVVTQTLTVDSTLPVIAINHGSVYATNDVTPTIAGTTDAVQGVLVTVTINGGSAMTASVQDDGSWNATPSALVPGTYTIVASVSDAASNVGTYTQTLTIDIIAPTVTIDGGASRSTGDATPTISGTASGAPAGSVVVVTVDGQTLSTTTTGAGTWTVTAAHINNLIRVVAASVTDAAGNVGSGTQSLTINAISPTITITGGAVASTTDATPTISGTSTASTGSVVVVTMGVQTLNATVQPGGSWNVTSGNTGNAAYSVTATVTDADGNVGAAIQTLTVNSNAPTLITITGGLTRVTNDDTPTISGVTDAADGRTITVSVNGQVMPVVATSGIWSVTAVHIPDGVYTVNVSVSTDGNLGSASQLLTIDTAAPVVILPGGGLIVTTDTTPTITGSGATPGATVTVTVAGQTLTTTVGADGTWSVTPLIPLLPGAHTVVVTITDAAGNLGTATQVINVADLPTMLPDFSSVGPSRVFDTRPGQSPLALRTVAKQQVGGGYELQVQMTDLATIVPAAGVGAVSLNVTSTGSMVDGFITVYGCGARELVSSVNFAAGVTVANAVVAPVSASGMVCFYSNTPTDIIVDVNGWFATGAAYTPVGPKRVFDTRPGNSPAALRTVPKTKVAADSMIEVRLTDLAGYIPGDGVGAVSLNVIVTNPEATGFITVFPCGSRTLVSSINYVAGQTVANAVITPVSATGTVCFYSQAATDLIVDVNGWLMAGSDFTAVDPSRVLDTRPDNSPNALRVVPKAKIGGANVLEVRVTDLVGRVPAFGVGAVSLNVTATNPDASGFLTVFACGAMEQVSSLNFNAGTTVANAVIAPVSATGTICLYSNVPTDVIVDVNGWISTAGSG
ncbi:MAG: Ig-like domain-containing protein [Ilumatobacteraceae bacterium]